MQVLRAILPESERADFEHAIRACGKDPDAFTAELFEAALDGAGAARLRRVHVRALGSCCAAQYDAGGEVSWTGKFAMHLALGRFG